MALLNKESISLGLFYRFRGLVHYHHGRKHDNKQVATVLEQNPRAYILKQQQGEREFGMAWAFET